MSNELIVNACLENLFKIANSSTGILNAIDESHAKELFKALHKKGFTLDQDAVYQQAIAHKWSDKHAKSLAKLAAQIDGGGRVIIKHSRNWGEPTVDRVIAQHK
ncbi:hypothetical protein L5M36_03400 [Shewanella sp. SM72]|uniref:DUF1889 family protein n=1 Tax=Shewanella sp. SM72 TaxID=2912805 RepID=UPI0021D8A03E|nr:DUF1889 family protein [Shewanella sp. SM72]MCU8015945.1 hypothetical protein [Shewanella sp. SM72]